MLADTPSRMAITAVLPLRFCVHCGRVEYQTVTAILAVSKDIAEEIVYSDEVSIPRQLGRRTNWGKLPS